jgi:soluble lytic murein transglycosylase
VGLQKFADPFLARLVADAEDITDYQLAARLAHETGRDYYAVQANKDVQMKQGLYLAESGYPLLSFSPPPAPEKPLIHAIIHRESMYNPQAMSSVGALGLMQLMPGTAKAVSKRKKLAFSKDRLTADPKYNVQIGAAYFEGLMKDYEDYYPFAIAAYNAGPVNVRKWIDAFGDPARGQIPVVDWVEMISNYETRNYVQRVMESFYMYRLRLHQVPVTVEDLATRPAAKEKPAVKKD